MLRHVFYAVAAVLLLNAASAAFADDSRAENTMRLVGLEPTAYGLKVRCSTN